MRRGAKRVLLVSHGGTLRETFGSRFQNAEGRVVDIFQDGSFAFAVPPEASSCTSRSRSSRRAKSLGGSFSSEYSDYSDPDILDSCSFGSETSSCSFQHPLGQRVVYLHDRPMLATAVL